MYTLVTESNWMKNLLVPNLTCVQLFQISKLHSMSFSWQPHVLAWVPKNAEPKVKRLVILLHQWGHSRGAAVKGRGHEEEQMENQYEDAHHVPLIAPSSRQLRLMDIQTAFQDCLSRRKRGLRVGNNLSNKSSFPQVRKTGL